MNPSPITNIEQQIREITNLISLPEIYLKFRRLMDDPAADIHDFGEIVQLDPNLSISVLKMVNSAYYGLPDKIDSVSQAVNMLGISQLHSMVLGLSAISSLDFPNDIVPLKTFWRCSLYCGVLVRLLARKRKLRNNERLFVLGLLHEIGHLVLYARFPEEARAALQLAREQDLPMHKAELQIMGIHYGEVGATLMAHWDLSDEFQSSTRCQPEPRTAQADAVETGLLHIAHAYARQQFKEIGVPADMLVDPVAWEMTGLSAPEVEDCLESALAFSADMERVIKV